MLRRCAAKKSNSRAVLPNDPQVAADISEGTDRRIQVLPLMSSANLYSDARLALGHHWIAETNLGGRGGAQE